MECSEQERSPRSPGSPLRVLVLSDGRPGHFNQAKGVLKALRFHREIDEEWVHVRLRAAIARPVLAKLLNTCSRGLPRRVLNWCYVTDEISSASPDLILSAGGNTSFANSWLAREFRCRNLFVGEPRRLRAGCFWRCLTYVPREPSPPFIHWKVTPVPILAEEIEAEGRKYLESEGLAGQPLWTLLVGGDGGGCRYSLEDWNALLAGLRAMAQTAGIRWLIVTSRRTGAEGEAVFAAARQDPMMARLSLYTEDQGRRYRDFLGAGQRVVTTEDSHMMLTEAISTGRPVLCVRPRIAQPDWTGQLFLENYTSAGYAIRAEISQLARPDFTWSPSGAVFQSPLRELGTMIHGWLKAEGV